MCPLEELDFHRENSPAGRLLDRALRLDSVVADFQIPWSEVTVEEVKALRVLREERRNLEIEQRQQQEDQARLERMRQRSSG